MQVSWCAMKVSNVALHFCAVSLVTCRLAVFQEERTVQIPLDKLPGNKGRTFITCLFDIRIVYVVILAG
jgi:hypothetical protein